MVTVLAADGGGSLLPEWLADAPPWLQALALLGALVGAIALGTATVWAPALADRIRGRSTTPPGDASTEAPAGSPTTPSSARAPDADAKMQLIDRMVSGLERQLEEADRRAEDLQRAVTELQHQLAAARTEISNLTWQRDQLLQRMGPPRPDRSPGS